MKRDMDLVRKLVLALEEAPCGCPELKIEGYTDEQIGYHAYLMMDGGLARGTETTNPDSSMPEAMLANLTWKGHEFADAARPIRCGRKPRASFKENWVR